LLDIRKIIGEKTKVKKFDSIVISRILNDKRYTGIFSYKGKIYHDIIPPIVTAEQQREALQNYKRTSRTSNVYFFKGVVYCNICKKELSATHGTNNQNKKYYYYKCKNCGGNISQNFLMDYVQSFNANTIKRESQIVRLKKELPKIKHRVQRIKEKYILQHVSEQEYCALIMPLIEEQTNIEVRIKVLDLNAYGHKDFLAITDSEKFEYIHNNFKIIWVNIHAKKIQKIDFFES
jgi:DNA-directed RNA polymerase subunit RPC12/RpoP